MIIKLFLYKKLYIYNNITFIYIVALVALFNGIFLNLFFGDTTTFMEAIKISIHNILIQFYKINCYYLEGQNHIQHLY